MFLICHQLSNLIYKPSEQSMHISIQQSDHIENSKQQTQSSSNSHKLRIRTFLIIISFIIFNVVWMYQLIAYTQQGWKQGQEKSIAVQENNTRMEIVQSLQSSQKQENLSELEQQNITQQQKIKMFNDWIRTRKQPKRIKISKNHNIKQLPFCLIFDEDYNEQITQQTLNYSNFYILPLPHSQLYRQNDSQLLNLTYLNYQIHSHCVFNSIIVFLNAILPPSFLYSLNTLYQTKKVWVSFKLTANQVQLVSAYQRLLILAAENNLTKNLATHDIINKNQLVFDLLEMSKDHLLETPFYNLSQLTAPLSSYIPKYQPLLNMEQFSWKNKTQQENNYNKMLQNRLTQYRAQVRLLKQQNMLNAIQFRQLLYLPENHTIADLQRQTFESKYSLENFKNEKHICVIILSFNNVKDNRFQRVIDSVVQQEYTNFHIVFIDDRSTDGTLLQTMRHTRKRNFPSQRIHYIQNLRKNYATYNFVNAAFNYCSPTDIMVILDGDDELIGRQIFKLINRSYHPDHVWLMYTNFMNSLYYYGTSRKIKNYVNYEKNQRNSGHFIGQLRTLYVALMRHIKLKDHQCIEGEWLQTVYDDAVQHPLIEMASPLHIEMLKQICYFYNVNYGNNDNSTQWKKKYRQGLYKEQILKRKPYRPLQKLDFNYEDADVRRVLSEDYNVRYRNITEQNQILEVKETNQTSSRCREYIFAKIKYHPPK